MLVRCYRQRVSDFDVKTQLRNQQELRTVILRSHHISSLRTPAEQSFDAWKWWHIAGDGEQESKMHNTSVSYCFVNRKIRDKNIPQEDQFHNHHIWVVWGVF